VYVSATPGERELRHLAEVTGQNIPSGLLHVEGEGGARKAESGIRETKQSMEELLENIEGIAKMEIRPTGLLDPEIEVRSTEGQVQDLLSEIGDRVSRDERVLVTVMTIKFAEEVAEYLEGMGVKAHYLHSEIDTLERTEIIKALRLGLIDVIVGINLLREGLDIPEVSLVAIFDADKQGFLRNERSLLQTIGRASRNVNGSVILYADSVSSSMEAAISQTVRRRGLQGEHNEKNGIIPKTIQKALPVMGAEIEDLVSGVAGRGSEGGKRMVAKPPGKKGLEGLAKRFGLGAGVWNNSGSVLENVSQPEWTGEEDIDIDDDGEADIVSRLEMEMRQAADRLDFERAAELRDRIYKIGNTTN
ncbi:MAG: helicase-related protein, partial [Candidatus Thermoplasmatota archaeon]|nr:helicase-related protein [Candidatus Thermoplasmatota archaeon]